jgi:hypothetical protein
MKACLESQGCPVTYVMEASSLVSENDEEKGRRTTHVDFTRANYFRDICEDLISMYMLRVRREREKGREQ